MLKINNIQAENINFFADAELNVGDIVAPMDHRPNVVCKVSQAKFKTPVGISLQNVVKFNNTYRIMYNRPVVGSRIQILTRGQIMTKMAKSLRLPIYQPIYVDMQRNSLTWKKLGPMVGKTSKHQDPDGYVVAEVDFSQ